MDAELGEVVSAAGCKMVWQGSGCEEGQSEIRSLQMKCQTPFIINPPYNQ